MKTNRKRKFLGKQAAKHAKSLPAKSVLKPSTPSQASIPVVGVGASAGGLEAFAELLKHLPGDTGMAFILVQHLSPDYESELTQLLSRASIMPTQEVTHNFKVQANHVYVIAPNTQLAIKESILRPSRRIASRTPQRAIDFFFESLALDRREQSIGVILSGTATDGTLGLEAIKAEGGITFAQDNTAKYDSMPRSAISAGCVDFVLSPANIARELAQIAKHPYVAGQSSIGVENERALVVVHEDDGTPLPPGGHGTPDTGGKRVVKEARRKTGSPPGEEGFKKVLVLLRNHSGVDFSLYKSNTIHRRITRRMALNKMTSIGDYAGFLSGNTKELDSLYSDVLISVTSFFRNPEAFDTLRSKVFPKLMQDRANKPLRVWILGCSTGQEAYSLAMAFEEFLDKFSRKPKVQIFATDLNEALLEKARAGLYAKTLVQDIPADKLRRFFVEEEGGYRVAKSLREIVVFARQNLLHDPPFSRMDLITCRNVLIYLDGGLQKKILPLFHYALQPGGYLALDNKIDGVVLVVVDIDALKRSEQETKAARDYAEATLRAAPVPLLILRPDLRVDLANEAFYRAFKSSPQETEGRLVYELGNGQWRIPKLQEFLEEIIPRNSFFQSFEVTHDFPRIGSRTMFLHGRRLDTTEGTPHRILVAIEDFTGRIQAEAALRASEVRFRRLFEAAHDGILIVDPNTRTITDSNPYMTELLGYTHEDFLGKELSDLGFLKDREDSNAAFAQLRQHAAIRLDNLRVQSKSGEQRDIEIIANQYREDDREVIQCNIRDITVRKRNELEISNAKAELERANSFLEQRVHDRTAALQELNARLHELSTRLLKAQEDERRRIARELHDQVGQALTSLKLFLQRAEGKKTAPTIKQAQDIVSSVMQQVRQLSVDLHPHVLEDLGLKAALQSHIKAYLERTHINVSFDCANLLEEALSQDIRTTVFRIVQEALTNIARHANTSKAEVKLYGEENALHIEVHDSGKGFEVNPKMSGATLGLFGMRERVMLAGGSFRVVSKPGDGTHLFVSVPCQNLNVS